MLERVVLDTETRSVNFLDLAPDHQRASNWCGLIRGNEWADTEWDLESSRLSFVSTSRDYKEVTLRTYIPATGQIREIYRERDEIFFESNLTSRRSEEHTSELQSRGHLVCRLLL